jgi:hypothetical protein
MPMDLTLVKSSKQELGADTSSAVRLRGIATTLAIRLQPSRLSVVSVWPPFSASNS